MKAAVSHANWNSLGVCGREGMWRESLLEWLLAYVDVEKVDAMDGWVRCVCVCGDGGRGKLKDPRPWWV
jgi:hypothetical protein